jgi:hypothetical protein
MAKNASVKKEKTAVLLITPETGRLRRWAVYCN